MAKLYITSIPIFIHDLFEILNGFNETKVSLYVEKIFILPNETYRLYGCVIKASSMYDFTIL